MMGGRCSSSSPDHAYEESSAKAETGGGSAWKKARSERVADAQSPVRVTKTLFMSSDSDGSSSEDEASPGAAQQGRPSRNSEDSNKENDAAGGEFRHRARRVERLQHVLSGSPSTMWGSPSVLLTNKLGAKLSMKTPPPVSASARARTTPGKTVRTDLLERKLLLKLSNQNSTCPDVLSTDILDTLSWLGAGVSSDVYKVRLGPEDACYAVKKSKFELRNDRERSLLLREIKILSKLDSSASNFDNIVRYYQAWQEHAYFYLLLELCDGGTLKDFLANREPQSSLSEPYLWYILHQIAGALVVLSAHDIVHLDIKPDNIFITRSGRLKVGDFGVATDVIASSSRRIEETEGDAVYMAPELLSSSNRLPSADVFCLGISLLEMMLQVQLPADGDEWHELRQGKLPDMPSTYSTKLQLLVAQMMHPDPERRPTASEILKAAADSHNASESAALFKEYVRLRSALVAATPATRGGTRRSLLMSAKTPRKRRISLP